MHTRSHLLNCFSQYFINYQNKSFKYLLSMIFQLYHEAQSLNLQQINALASLTDKRNMDEILDNICVPRVVGTPGHERVKKVKKFNTNCKKFYLNKYCRGNKIY